MRSLLLARHAHAGVNELGIANGVPPGDGLTARGVAEARMLATAIAADDVTLAVVTGLTRTRETADLALAGRDVPAIVSPELTEVGYGSFEGGPLTAYLEWAWASPAAAECPGGGESRADAVRRVAAGLATITERDEDTVLVISHGAVVRWVVDASRGLAPRARVEPVGFAQLHRLDVGDVERAARALTEWAARPRFDEPRRGD